MLRLDQSKNHPSVSASILFQTYISLVMTFPGTPRLEGYTAVPSRILAIPSTDYVVITPKIPIVTADWANHVRSESAIPSESDDPIEGDFPRRKRGRPYGKTVPCQCPTCEAGGGGRDRHLCHHPYCGRTFTKRCHLQAHLRYH